MKSQFPSKILEQLERSGVVAVLVVDDPKHAVPLARALLAGGISIMELTLRTDAALEALRRVHAEVPEMLAGAGTVLTPEQVRQAQQAGAAFAVAPGLNSRVVKAAQDAGLPFAPGVVTPSDIEAAIELGCRELKFFPAEPSGGLGYLKTMTSPYAHLGLRFVPLGGLKLEHVPSYLAEPSVLAVGGSWLAPRDTIRRADWATIQAAAAEARAAADAVRRR